MVAMTMSTFPLTYNGTDEKQYLSRLVTNKMACAPSEASDQPGLPPSLIRVFAVRMKTAWVLSYPLSAQRRLIRLGDMFNLYEV